MLRIAFHAPRNCKVLDSSCRNFRSTVGTCVNISSLIRIGDVSVPTGPTGSGRPDLAPKLPPEFVQNYCYSENLPPCWLSHLRWMLQKDLDLKQDFLLLGAPELARDRRHLIMLYAALVGREVEYLSLSQDTSDADLKQRKEVRNNGTMYVNQSPVRAALNGRLLILDGLEKAERNVLPTLNNILENREMSLDDGGMLIPPAVFDSFHNDYKKFENLNSKIHRVHPDFRVAALGSISKGESLTLDPPLRSRFQARLVETVSMENALIATSTESSGLLDISILKELILLASETPNEVSLRSMHDAVTYLENQKYSLTIEAALSSRGMNMDRKFLAVDDLLSPLTIKAPKEEITTSDFVETRTTRRVADLIKSGFESGFRAVVCVGPKGCFKSALAKEMAQIYGAKAELFSLHSDMTSRDLLMTRATDELSGDTIWRHTPLARAVQQGHWVILDGIDKVRPDTLTSLALLMEQGWIELPDSNRLYAKDGFRSIALAHSINKNSWITSEIIPMFHWIEVQPLPSEEIHEILINLYPSLNKETLSKILELKDSLELAISVGASDTKEKGENLSLTLRKLKHICKRVEQRGDSKLAQIVHNTLMINFLPDREKKIVMTCMSKCGIVPNNDEYQEKTSTFELDEELLRSCRRVPKNPLLVPNPQFEENPGQIRILLDILEAHSVGEKALLITGYQGVGKNRIVDYLLSILSCEREYLQLHRDTTIQSLLSMPSVENGQIKFHDSPLVRAAKNGQILVLDEADKAPVEVVALLKGLIEDGELALPNGQTLVFEDRSRSDCVQIHPDFRIWALANPTGYPFHGNDLAREMADVFSCHNVPPMDVDSHKHILRSYGSNLDGDTINKLVRIWEELRIAHENGVISYPFSIRESISVVKHLNLYPSDGIEKAIDNVIAFDRFDTSLTKQLNDIFVQYGISVLGPDPSNNKIYFEQGGLSTPKTRSSSPKHGKVDSSNSPHVGGNQWAGGTGGSDTAGLGGRGGPYRLDEGHPVHQISEEMKKEVSKEAQRRAREMAKQALKQKLKELNMGKLDWNRYNGLRARVEDQICQLQNHLKDLKTRKEERIWLKRQTSGELDDSRIVDAIAGELDVFRRRGHSSDRTFDVSSLVSNPILIKLVVDVSASMYRFNGYDNRLERLLEASILIMESLRDNPLFQLEIIGHNGTSAKIPLVDGSSNLNELNQLRVLEKMVAHSQYTYAGDSTLEAIHAAVKEANKGDLIFVITDANLRRYNITASDLEILQSRDVHSHLILIGSLGDEASDLVREIPNERAQICFKSSELPLIIKKLVTGSLKD